MFTFHSQTPTNGGKKACLSDNETKTKVIALKHNFSLEGANNNWREENEMESVSSVLGSSGMLGWAQPRKKAPAMGWKRLKVNYNGSMVNLIHLLPSCEMHAQLEICFLIFDD